MPDREVSAIRDHIHYQHAKVIARSASAASDGVPGLCPFYRLKPSMAPSRCFSHLPLPQLLRHARHGGSDGDEVINGA